MTELEIFAKATIERGGVWHEIQKRGHFVLYKTGGRYMANGQRFNDVVVYQIFEDGKRVLAVTDFKEGLRSFERLTVGAS